MHRQTNVCSPQSFQLFSLTSSSFFPLFLAASLSFLSSSRSLFCSSSYLHHETHLRVPPFSGTFSASSVSVQPNNSPATLLLLEFLPPLYYISTCVFPSLSVVLSRDPLQLLFLLYNLLAAFHSACCILLQVDRTPPVMELLTPSNKPLFSS